MPDEPGLAEPRIPAWVGAAAGLVVAAGVATVAFGRVILDEGWYLQAGRLVAQGQVPFRDFFFPQMPASAYLFAPVGGLGGASLVAARALCLALGLTGVFLGLRAAWRTGGPGALACAAALLLPCASFWYGIATARSYALVVLLVAAGVDRLAADRGDGRAYAAGAALLSAATAARLSLVPLVALVCVAGLWRWRDDRRACLGLVFAAVVPGALLAAPFVHLAGDRFWFGVVDFHNAYYGASAATPTWRFVGPLLRGVLVDQPLALAALVAAVIAYARSAAARRAARTAGGVALGPLLLVGWLLLFALHATRTAPFAHHQTMFLPVLAIGIAATLGPLVRLGPVRRLAPVVFLASLTAIPWQDWPPPWRHPGAPARVGEAAALVGRAAAGRAIIAFDPLLAVLSGAPIVPGYESGGFSYWPGFSGAARLGGRDQHDLARDLERRAAAVVALDHVDLERLRATAGSAPVTSALRQRYEVAFRVPRYGQWGRELVVFTARPVAPASAPTSP